MPRITVVIPFHNSEPTLGACLDALIGQNIARSEYEIIAVDDGSTDRSGEIASRPGVRVIRQRNGGAPAARNAGLRAATTEWVAFTDADCLPSRGWLRALLAVATAGDGNVMGVAGPVVGQPTNATAARYVDISGGLDSERHLSHPRFPFAPSGNVMYRKAALDAVGGFDHRFSAYDACDLHARLRETVNGTMMFAKSAVVMHRHRDTWPGYWKQQVNYGRGLAQFYITRSAEIRWTPLHEAKEWLALAPAGILACLPGRDNLALLRRGTFVKRLAQRVGFTRTFFSTVERSRWKNGLSKA